MKFDQGRALVIGVADYKTVSSLSEAVRNDARDIADILKSPSLCGYPENNVKILLDNEATLTGIRDALGELAADATAEDTVTIFFSGHGARIGTGAAATSALAPYDCDVADLAGTSMGEAELSTAIAQIEAPRVVVVLDSCHAGGSISLKNAGLGSAAIEEGFDEKSLQQLATGTGRVVFASSRASETSGICKGKRNSVFTTAILAGMRGAAAQVGDDVIRVFDLFNYVSEAVRKAVPGKQHPILKVSDLEENFPIALALGVSKSIGQGSVVQQRKLEQIMADLFPTGPMDIHLWQRAGGDVSRLRLDGNGRAQWFHALRLLSQGGGGAEISRESLIDTALEEFPSHRELKVLRGNAV